MYFTERFTFHFTNQCHIKFGSQHFW